MDLWKTDTTNLLPICVVLISRNAKEIFPSNTDSNLMLQCSLCDLIESRKIKTSATPRDCFSLRSLVFLIKKVIY